MKTRVIALLSVLLMSLVPAARAQDKPATELTWYGHAAFKLVTPQGHILFIDPWLLNPLNPDGQADLDAIDRADLVLVSHGHFDHVGSTVQIAKKTGARLVTTYDLGNTLVAYGGFPAAQAGFDSLGNFGGTLRFFEGEVEITLVPAVHSSSVNPKALGLSETDTPEYGGNPGGFLIRIEDGPTIYHTGDTDAFGDMAMINGPVDIMLACIGDHFTMGPERAAQAVALVNPNIVIPMHYGTFPEVMPGNVSDFRTFLQDLQMEDKLHPIELEKPARF